MAWRRYKSSFGEYIKVIIMNADAVGRENSKFEMLQSEKLVCKCALLKFIFWFSQKKQTNFRVSLFLCVYTVVVRLLWATNKESILYTCRVERNSLNSLVLSELVTCNQVSRIGSYSKKRLHTRFPWLSLSFEWIWTLMETLQREEEHLYIVDCKEKNVLDRSVYSINYVLYTGKFKWNFLQQEFNIWNKNKKLVFFSFFYVCGIQ